MLGSNMGGGYSTFPFIPQFTNTINSHNITFLVSPSKQIMYNMNYIKRIYLEGKKLMILTNDDIKTELYEYENIESALLGISAIGGKVENIIITEQKDTERMAESIKSMSSDIEVGGQCRI